MRDERRILGKVLLIVVLLFLSACSAQKRVDDDFLVDGKDPFDNAFFADSPEWDSSVLQQSEVLSSTEAMKESDEPKTFVEKSEEALFGTLLIGAMAAKIIFIPFLGL
jgi:hypothetical protein